ncbi:MAG: 5-formyltetrahydrofolate cyclo-ligase [Candidatus Dadabacteria bacterium]|nr:5-formyltetrahydrofolate cyclo-ligase [Candidatus Dadabacteria bacterium]
MEPRERETGKEPETGGGGGRLTKQNIRRRYASIRNGKPPSVLADLSARVVANLCGGALFESSHTIALYAAHAGEVDLSAAVPLIRAAGKRVFFPRVCPEGLRFFEVRSTDELSPGSFSIPEPAVDGGREALPSGLDLMVIPGLCFDRFGFRVGSGKGFYDRATEGVDPARVCGAAYSFQLVSFEIPAESHDRRAGFIVTEEGVFGVQTKREGEKNV